MKLDKVYEEEYTYLTDHKDYFWATGNIPAIRAGICCQLPDTLRKKLRFVKYKPTNTDYVLSYNPVLNTVDQKDWRFLDVDET